MNDKTLVYTTGLPGSGKTTWAKKELTDLQNAGLKVIRVNNDDFRRSLFGVNFDQKFERTIGQMRQAALAAAKDYDHVLVDNCNLSPKAVRELEVVASVQSRQLVKRDFTHIPLEVCVERDMLREASVGRAVIERMATQFLGYQAPPPEAPQPGVYTPDPEAPPAIIVDIDGTVALHDGIRGHYDMASAGKDAINKPIVQLIHDYYSAEFRDRRDPLMLMVSGREEKYRKLTEDWLHGNDLWPDHLYMRPNDDGRRDDIVKREIFDRYIRDYYNVQFVLDDRDRVVKMWRSLGLTCLQVAEGNF